MIVTDSYLVKWPSFLLSMEMRCFRLVTYLFIGTAWVLLLSLLILAKIHLLAWKLLYCLKYHLHAEINCLLQDNFRTGPCESIQSDLLHFDLFGRIQSGTDSYQVLDFNYVAIFLYRPSSFILVFHHITAVWLSLLGFSYSQADLMKVHHHYCLGFQSHVNNYYSFSPCSFFH